MGPNSNPPNQKLEGEASSLFGKPYGDSDNNTCESVWGVSITLNFHLGKALRHLCPEPSCLVLSVATAKEETLWKSVTPCQHEVELR